MDFYQVRERTTKNGTEIYPDFIVRPSSDLMVRGGSFHAVWNEDVGLWSKDEYEVQRLVDAGLYAYADTLEERPSIRSLSSYKTNSWKDFRSYIGNMPNSHAELDGVLAFADTPLKKGDYCSKRLPYALKPGPIDSYEKLMGTLFGPEEREKLEWAIGSIVAGDSKHIQKFFVLYGEAGTGKSTFLRILQMLFDGYHATFDAKALTGSSNAFATEAFKTNPLVAIQHDGDLSKIEDNTRLNSIVSHEDIVINEKYKTPYPGRINALLFMGTNQSVKITDAKSGLIRRLIDVHPTGEKLPSEEYDAKIMGISFELGAIAHYCLEVYRQRGMNYYAHYRPTDMIVRTDVFYNFLMANYETFKEQDYTTLQQAWLLYKDFCDEGRYDWRLNKGKFRDELRNYWKHFNARGRVEGTQVWNLYEGFKTDKLGIPPAPERPPPSLTMEWTTSLLDEMLAEEPAQYASSDDKPLKAWANVTTTLSELDTTKMHFVKPGLQHIVIDFDLKDVDGNKDLALNLEEASKWPHTYAEFSKSGSGVHLHYLYDGDIDELSNVYAAGIEVKTFRGDASLRRKLTRCNNIPVATISGGLPRKERRVLDAETMKSERALRDLIGRNLRKEIHPGTKPSVDFIFKILEDAYSSGLSYDVTDLRGRVLAFANGSNNNSIYCVRLVTTMKFASDDTKPVEEKTKPEEDRIVFWDVEVYPNLFVCCWKYEGDADVVKMLNPSPEAIEELTRMKLVGFNNRRYDNHIMYGRIMGYSNLNLFHLSQRLVKGERNAPFGEAYGLSHADIWDFSSKKQSLKRFQIELGLNHLEIGLPWDEPVPEDQWEKVVDYCANDVVTSEAVFNDRKQDYVARQILADLAGLHVNDTTQKLTAKIIFGTDRKPQEKFKYTDLSEQFPGYVYSFGKSTYRDEEIGEGGYVYAEPGMYSEVAVLDVASMHPTSITLLDLFGPYTKAFSDLTAARIAIKRRDYVAARRMLDGRLKPYLGSEDDAKALAGALKIVINIVYGLTAATFDNPFRDIRNKDNIVAKRGALFMVDLKLAVQDRGFQVVHIKTDSIKIPGADPEIIQFVIDFGKKYGYDFEHETTYSKFCLVNDAVYIAKEANGEWTATGAQFAHPYVFKSLFSKQPIVFDDYCETKTVTTALYLQFEGEEEPHFVGRAGAFVPVKEGTGGGQLLREKDGKFHAVTGTKGYHWREAITLKELGSEDDIDLRYFRKLVDDAIKNISKYGDIEWFAS